MARSPLRRRLPRRADGFTAAEVIVAIAVIALAVLPVFYTTTSGQKNVRLTEYHVIAQTRAKRILEAYGTYGFEELLEAAGGGSGPLPPPFTDDQLDSVDMALPEEYQRKMENFREEHEFESLGQDLGRVRVTIMWDIGGHTRKLSLSRFVAREGLGEPVRPPLRQVGS